MDTYLVQKFADSLDCLHSVSILATLDIMSEYWQILMREKDIKKMAFLCPETLIKFIQRLFSLKNAGVTLQRALGLLMMGLTYEGVLIFLNDLIVFASIYRMFFEWQESVLKPLVTTNFELIQSKCYFGYDQVRYVGHIVS